MGLQLDLLPLQGDSWDSAISNELIRVDDIETRELEETLRALPRQVVPKYFGTHRPDISLEDVEDPEDYRWGDTQKDAYDDPLHIVTMGELAKVGLTGPPGAYVAASRPEQRVALYWH